MLQCSKLAEPQYVISKFYPGAARVAHEGRLRSRGESKDGPRTRNRTEAARSRPVRFGGLKGDGAWGRIRTTDTRIFNPLLYQLSYPGPREPRL
jgi:hypothetical protein